jgi:hypothetical protein
MPNSLPLLRQQCVIIDGRTLPDYSVHESDDEEIDVFQHRRDVDAENLMNFVAQNFIDKIPDEFEEI